MRTLLTVLVVLAGCGWPSVAPAPRDDLSAVQAEAYRALAHSLAGYMTASAKDAELDVELAGILEEVLLHVRAVKDDEWQKARLEIEGELGPARVPNQTVVPVLLEGDAPWRTRWYYGEQLSGERGLDDILRAYDIQVQRTGTDVTGYYALTVPREVNAFALANLIGRVPGILFPLPDWDLYDWGNSLKFRSGVTLRPETRIGGWWLRVALGWGDCPSGCTDWRMFEFEVDTDGGTRLVRTKGDPLP